MGGWGDDREPDGHDAGHVSANHHAGGCLHGWEDDLAASAHLHGASAPMSPGDNERLDLNDGDRLPWLEGDEDDYVEKVSTGRVIVAGLGALVVVGAVVGGIWWATHRHALGAPVPDGSIVTPTSAQYKDAPADPGGKTFQGTGDTSYVVSQGQNRQAQLADGDSNAAAGGPVSGNVQGTAPGDSAGKGGVPGASTDANGGGAAGAADAAPAGGVVQVGAFSSKDLAEAGWSRLSIQHPSLAQQHHRILQGQADIGTVWRLQVVTGAGGGNALCDRLRGEGLSCQVKH